MAEALLSSVLSNGCKLLAAIRSSASSPPSSDPRSCVEKDLNRLTELLPRIKAVLRDAEEREIRDESVKLWLSELEDVAYEAEDVLDEYNYEFLRAQVEGKAAAEARGKRKLVEQGEKVQGSTSSSSSNVSIPCGMAGRIRAIMDRFDGISVDRERLQLHEGDGERRARGRYPPPTGHLVDESTVYGRDQDRKELIDLLLSQNKENALSVIPIVGAGGIGKTTLAQLVYNDASVKEHFNLRGWVSVSEDFDVVRLTRAIIESITKQACNLTDLSPLQEILREKLNGKNLLLVLDNVWNERRRSWESLREPFLGSGAAVCIIVTTRNLSVAEIMQTVDPRRPGYLPEDQCWLLFQRHAFHGRDPSQHPDLIKIGEQIVRRCHGLPLAVKTLGGLLQGELDEGFWEDILQSELWEIKQEDDNDNEILAALTLSYTWMPAYLKPCFLYLSMYPKDHRYDKDDVVLLWIANGYIQPRGNRKMEDVGKEYFEALLKRSMLEAQPVEALPLRESAYDYLMHDMIHDLAQSISAKKCLSISGRPRHLYVGVKDYKETADSLYHNGMVWRTLLAPEDSHKMNCLSMIQWTRRLRALYLKCDYLDELPDSFGNLKHLRYLRICSTTLQRLPDSICCLYNLQILRLETFKLKELPINLGNLINLYYIDLIGDFESLPEPVIRLENLQTLIYKVT